MKCSETILGKNNNSPCELLAAGNFKHQNQWVKAGNCYAHDNICNNGKDGGDWFQMGECHRELKEYHLAELLMRKGATITREGHLLDRFVRGANEVHEIRCREEDIGLSVDLRNKERARILRKTEDGFQLDTYEFSEISNAANEATRSCQGVRDFFGVAKNAYTDGNLNLAIEIMQAAVNYAKSYGAKASALSMAARLQVACHQYDSAIRYLDWAIALDPDKKSFKELRVKIETIKK